MRLSEFMAVRNLNDDDVAAAIGRTRPTISRIRRGKTRPDWDTIEALREFSGGLITANDFEQLQAAE